MQEAAEGSAAARRRAGFLGERRLLSMPLPRHLGLRKCLYCPRKKSWPGVFLLCLGTLKGIPVGTIISHMASQKQNKTKQKKAKGKKKKEREKEKKSKVTWMLWPSTGKGEIHLGGYNLLWEIWKPVIKATVNWEQAVAQLKPLKEIPAFVYYTVGTRHQGCKWNGKCTCVNVVNFMGLGLLHPAPELICTTTFTVHCCLTGSHLDLRWCPTKQHLAFAVSLWQRSE